jgi:hypothetical protein
VVDIDDPRDLARLVRGVIAGDAVRVKLARPLARATEHELHLRVLGEPRPLRMVAESAGRGTSEGELVWLSPSNDDDRRRLEDLAAALPDATADGLDVPDDPAERAARLSARPPEHGDDEAESFDAPAEPPHFSAALEPAPLPDYGAAARFDAAAPEPEPEPEAMKLADSPPPADAPMELDVDLAVNLDEVRRDRPRPSVPPEAERALKTATLPPAPPTLSRRVPSMAEASSGFAAFFEAFATAAQADEADAELLDRLEHAAAHLLEGRAALVLCAESAEPGSGLAAQSAAGEWFPLEALLSPPQYDALARPLAVSLADREIVALRLEEDIGRTELQEIAALLAAEDADAEAFADPSLTDFLEHVDLLVRSQLLPDGQGLAWQTQLCLAQLVGALSALPVWSGGEDGAAVALYRHDLSPLLDALPESERAGEVLVNRGLIASALEPFGKQPTTDLAPLLVDLVNVEGHAAARAMLAARGAMGADDALQAALGDVQAANAEPAAEGFELADAEDFGFSATAAETSSTVDLLAEQPPVDPAERDAMCQALLGDPGAALDQLDAERGGADYSAALATLGAAAPGLAERGAAAELWQLLLYLKARREHGGDVALGYALRALAADGVLEPVARMVLEGPTEIREAARMVLTEMPEAAASALVRVRSRGTWPEGARRRFVAMLRPLGAAALPLLIDALELAAKQHDDGLAEDVLRSIGSHDPALGDRVARFCRHPAPAVRRAALVALSQLQMAGARETLVSALDDADLGVRLAAIGAFARAGGVDEPTVERLGPILLGETKSDASMQSAAASALAVADPSGHDAAIGALCKVVERPTGLRGLLRRGEHSDDLIEICCESLLVLDPTSGRPLVEQRRDASRGMLRERLDALLRRTG